MATEMCFLLVEDSDLGRLRGNAAHLASIVEQRDSDGELVTFGVNHRNVEIFHFILNGAAALSGGACDLFDTWLHSDKHARMRLTSEAFGLSSAEVRVLSDALSRLDSETVSGRWGEWKEMHGVVKDDDPTYFPECFPPYASFGVAY